MLSALITLQVAPCTGRALVEGGTGVHAVSHALRVGVGEISGAAAAVVDAANSAEAQRRAWHVVNCVVQGRAIRVIGRPRGGGRPGCDVCSASGAARGGGWRVSWCRVVLGS